MSKRLLSTHISLFVLLLLISCGGGSTVTSVSVTADPAQVNVRERSTITAKAEDSITGDTYGEKVTFTIRHNETGAELDIITDRLDANGEATAIYRAGGRQGVDIIEASFASGARATVTVRVGDAVVVGNIRLETFRDATGWRIRAVVTDAAGFPAPEQIVTFNTSNGQFIGNSNVATDNAGIAEVLLDLTGTTGGATVWATVGGLTASVTVGR
jgi:hypothetical protein